ncbi:hypothetical protein ATANTOWER_029971 [Ataeniobius toweri]|uniref:Uncharacterized protein n=1 Tax=Ataeniobius toweri TaxID=208326 RepID=A0ABU7C450_9TELE|nr:hypothetical protein [Ataeniobius toweri]
MWFLCWLLRMRRVCSCFCSPYDPVRTLTVKLSKIMSASKSGYKRHHMSFFLIAATPKSGDGHSTNDKEQNDGPAASSSSASVKDKDVISAVGGLKNQKKRRSGIDPAKKPSNDWK